MTPYDAYLVAVASAAGVFVFDEAGERLNADAVRLTPQERQDRLDDALAEFHLSEPTMPHHLRVAAAARLGRPAPPEPDAAEHDRQGLL